MPDIIDVVRSANSRSDIAFVEFDPAILTDYLEGQVPIGPEDLGSLTYAPELAKSITVVGILIEDVEHREFGKSDVIGTTLKCLFHPLVPLDRWPKPKRDSVPADPATDFYMTCAKDGETSVGRKKWYYTHSNLM